MLTAARRAAKILGAAVALPASLLIAGTTAAAASPVTADPPAPEEAHWEHPATDALLGEKTLSFGEIASLLAGSPI